MPTTPLCEQIRDDVRKFYASGAKSSNKVYAGPTADEGLSEADFATHLDAWYKTPGFIDEKAPRAGLKVWVRDYNREVAENKLKQSIRAGHKDKPPLDRGQELWTSGSRSGNCMEMAMVAVYVATTPPYSIPSARLWLGHIQFPGNHCFCFVLEENAKIAWKSVADMTTKSGRTVMVIDPWLNVACEGGQYEAKATEKLAKWQRVNKRIYWQSGPVGAGWYDPNRSYKKALITSPIEHQFCEERGEL